MFDFKGAVFDLDGTLVDSMNVWEKIDIDFLNKRNIEMPKDYVETINSMDFNKVAKYTIERFGLNEKEEDIIREWNQMAIYEYSYNINLKPYVKQYIRLLKENNIKIGLATASPRELYEPVLKNNEIYDLFDSFTTRNEVNTDKNKSDIYNLACKKLELLPNECIGFEDILCGIKSMKSIGMKAIGVYDKSALHEIEEIKLISDGFIYDFKELI